MTVSDRPYVVASCALSVDGRIDDASDRRLVLSNPADLDRVDELRASCDAVVVGANTIRRDNPRLRIRSARRRAARVAAGKPADPLRVTLTSSGNLDPAARFFAPPSPVGSADLAGPRTVDVARGATPPTDRPLVYCAHSAVATATAAFGAVADIVDAGDSLSAAFVLDHLCTEQAVTRVLVEGGSALLRQFLTAGLVDELHLAIAPFFVGDAAAPPFALPGRYPHGPADPMTLAEARRLGDVVVVRYLLGPGGTDHRFLRAAIELARSCPPSDTAFSVGAVVVAADGEVLATGYSREQHDHDHAEEVALRKIGRDPRLATATVYTSLEPCGARASRPVPCAQLIVSAGIRRVVYAWREPPLFAPGDGARQLRAAGITVIEVPELAEPAARVNAHLLRHRP